MLKEAENGWKVLKSLAHGDLIDVTTDFRFSMKLLGSPLK